MNLKIYYMDGWVCIGNNNFGIGVFKPDYAEMQIMKDIESTITEETLNDIPNFNKLRDHNNSRTQSRFKPTT